MRGGDDLPGEDNLPPQDAGEGAARPAQATKAPTAAGSQGNSQQAIPSTRQGLRAEEKGYLTPTQQMQLRKGCRAAKAKPAQRGLKVEMARSWIEGVAKSRTRPCIDSGPSRDLGIPDDHKWKEIHHAQTVLMSDLILFCRHCGKISASNRTLHLPCEPARSYGSKNLDHLLKGRCPPAKLGGERCVPARR